MTDKSSKLSAQSRDMLRKMDAEDNQRFDITDMNSGRIRQVAGVHNNIQALAAKNRPRTIVRRLLRRGEGLFLPVLIIGTLGTLGAVSAQTLIRYDTCYKTNECGLLGVVGVDQEALSKSNQVYPVLLLAGIITAYAVVGVLVSTELNAAWERFLARVNWQPDGVERENKELMDSIVGSLEEMRTRPLHLLELSKLQALDTVLEGIAFSPQDPAYVELQMMTTYAAELLRQMPVRE